MNCRSNDPPASTLLVIGYGNTLRGDDGCGWRVAEEVERWELPHVRVMTVHQLTPELAADIAAADTAIFVDARVGATNGRAELEHLTANPAAGVPAFGHAYSPCALLALAAALYGSAPRSSLITVPGVSFDFGEELSPTCQRGVGDALGLVRGIILTRE